MRAATRQRGGIVGGLMPRRWLVLIVASVAIFMSYLDATIVNIAFPSIHASFPDSKLSDLSWILNAYNIVFAALLVPAGRLADRFGRKRVFLAGILLFVAASVACGLAPSVTWLTGARVVQAVGAAAIVPTSLALLLPEFPVARRATATALWSATGGVAAAAGPSLGGVLVVVAGWRWVFFVNLFFGLPALIPAHRILREHRDEHGSAFPAPFGVGLLIAGVGSLTLGIVKSSDWDEPRMAVTFFAAAVLLAAFVLHARNAARPVVELPLFRVRSFAFANLGVFVFSVAFFALLLANVLFLTEVWHYSIVRAGFALTAGPLTATAMAPIGGRLCDRFGQRVVAVPGGIFFALGTLLLATRVGTSPAYAAAFLPGISLTGVGVGLTYSAFGSAAVAELPLNRFSTGSGIYTMSRQIGAAVGIALLIALLGTPGPDTALDTYHRLWALMIVGGLGSAAAGVSLGRVRARHVDALSNLRVAP